MTKKVICYVDEIKRKGYCKDADDNIYPFETVVEYPHLFKIKKTIKKSIPNIDDIIKSATMR